MPTKLAEIAGLVDDYVCRRLFRREVDFRDEYNYKVLADIKVQDFVTNTIRNVINELLGQPQYEVRSGTWRRLSDLARILVRENSSVLARRCIYPRMPVAARFGGLERKVMETTLDGSPEVRAWCKLQRKHGLSIAYRDSSGLLRHYEVDFILRTDESCFILETKADRDLALPNVGTKARAARHWCQSMAGLAPPIGLSQPTQWEYLLLAKSVYKGNEGASFSALLPLMRQTRDQVIASDQGTLFARRTGLLLFSLACRMVLGYHIICTAYGFWLPNDPRGSWSDFVRQWELLAHGPATQTDLRRSLARDPHNRKKRLEAKKSLRFDPVEFTGEQALCVGNGFARAIKESGYILLACSILPRHFHIVIARHTQLAERIAGHLKARATQELVAMGMHPFAHLRGKDGRFPSVWTHRPWKVYLNSYADIERSVKYVRDNPLKERKQRQNWSFVTEWVRPKTAPLLVAPSLADPLAGRFPRRK